MNSGKMHFNLLVLENEPIYSQLQMEEALLRLDQENWCIINTGSEPAIVLGVSGKPQEFVDPVTYQKLPLPLIRRFSGGGTVVVDRNTLFVSFIISKASLDLGVNPKAILEWTMGIYQPVFHPQPFGYIENDYTIADRKVGGNAHYFTRERWLHHTTFLWDYDEALMSCLLMPEKKPQYRKDRQHSDFIERLSNYYPHRTWLLDRFIHTLHAQHIVVSRTKNDVESILAKPHRQSVQRLLQW